MTQPENRMPLHGELASSLSRTRQRVGEQPGSRAAADESVIEY